MKNLPRILSLLFFNAIVGYGCMPLMMMDSKDSTHSNIAATSETSIKAGNLYAKVMISSTELEEESKATVQLTNLQTGKLYESAVVDFSVEYAAPESHHMSATADEVKIVDSLTTAHHEHWVPMEPNGSGQFGLTFATVESGSYKIQVRISALEGVELAEPVITGVTYQKIDHSRTDMQHGMMDGLGNYGVGAAAGMAVLMVVIMAFRWF